jgi:SOS response regulatory protein OraA/RecX
LAAVENQEKSAYRRALSLLARKPLTEHELRRTLRDKGHEPPAVDGAVERLLEDGYLDDRKLALHYILARTERLGHGAGRLLRDLEERGMERRVAESAWREAVEEHGLEQDALLRREAMRRIERCGGRLGVADYRRVYNALFRAGFDAHAIRSVIDDFRDGTENEFP